MSNAYVLGTSVKVSAEFEDLALEDFDPAMVICLVKRPPDGTETAYVFGVDVELVKDDVGRYHLWIETPVAGEYAYRFKGADNVSVANEATFTVEESAFATP